jgi:uncharacterized membrane protein YedE/YeeE
MQESELPGLTAGAVGQLRAGVVFGAVAQRTHFCTMGAVADIVNIGDWTRMRMWALAAGVAVLGFNAHGRRRLGRGPAQQLRGPRLIWLSNLLGGLLFGFGMVLASGCGSKTLVRIGGGNLKALVVFAVMALAAYATLRGITAVARVATVDAWPHAADRPGPAVLLAHATGWPRRRPALASAGPWDWRLVGFALAGRGAQREVLLGGLGSARWSSRCGGCRAGWAT